MFKRIKVLLLFIFMSSFFLGCKKENPNPELLDPIYLDLVKLHNDYKKEYEDEEKKTEALYKDLKEALPRSTEIRTARKAIKKHKRKLIRLRQKAKYYEVRKEHRRLISRKKYRISYYRGESWPNPKEFEAYKTNKRLKSADMNWQSRVPKLFKNNPNYIPGQMTSSTAKKEEGKK